MINVSENLKSLISEDSRTFRVRLINNLNTYEEIRSFKKSVMFPSSSLSIGNALSACIECTATDVPVSITGEKIKAEITILGCEEQILLGTYKAEKPTVKDGNVSFVAYDAMKTAGEKTYKSSFDEGEHTAQEYFTDICAVLGENCEALDEADGALVIAEDKLSGYSCRDALAYLAGYLGKNCIVNRYGLFEMIGFAAVDYDLFNEDRIAEPEFADSFCCLGYINCCIDNETTLQSGTGSNGFEFISPIMTQERLDAVGDTVFGENSVIREYMPCKVVQLLGDPRIEICDVLKLSYGGNVYNVPVMSVILEYDGGLMATAESYAPSEPQSTSLSERMSFAQKQAQDKADAYVNGIVEFAQMIQSAYGVKNTQIDGITYFHDKETLADSTYIFCITSEGLALASGQNCWGGSHKDTVWKYGLSKDGTAVLDMLNVFKITASLIRAGRLESNDGSVFVDLDEGIFGIKKKDDEGNDAYSATFAGEGASIEALQPVSTAKLYELSEKEQAALDSSGYEEGSLLYLALKVIILAQKMKYGITLSGADLDGNTHRTFHSCNRSAMIKQGKDSAKTTERTVDGTFSDGSQTFEAPEMYFNGKVYFNGVKLDGDKAAITIRLGEDVTLGVLNTYTKIPFDMVAQTTSDRLTISENGVRVGKNIRYIKVSGQAFVKTGSAHGTRHIRIQKISGGITRNYAWEYITVGSSSSASFHFTPIIIPVEEDDLIIMAYHTGDAEDINVSGYTSSGLQTYLTVEELQDGVGSSGGASAIPDNVLTEDDLSEAINTALAQAKESGEFKGDKGDSFKASVQDYGAKGDGVADETEAFQTALAKNRLVYVPEGTYIISDTLTIEENCEFELSQATHLKFTQTDKHCIAMKRISSLKGNHATITVPYTFSANVIHASTDVDVDDNLATPPFTRWDPQWKNSRYVTDINICKPDSRGFHYSVDGDCYGTAIYLGCYRDIGKYMWGVNMSGVRIAGGFTYGIHIYNETGVTSSGEEDNAWNHDMRIEAVMDACETGVLVETCNNAHLNVTIQPRPALKSDGVTYVPYAKYGIKLVNSKNIDLSSSCVWDWNEKGTLWTADNEHQHIVMLGQCRGLVLSDFKYYEESTDIRKSIYTDTPSNLEKMIVLQEPITRWFKPINNEPYFSDGYSEKRLLLKEEFDNCFITDNVPAFEDVLSTATGTDGKIYNDIGYKLGVRFASLGTGVETDSAYYGLTGFIPCEKGSKIYAEELSFNVGDTYCGMVWYDADKNRINSANRNHIVANDQSSFYNSELTDNGFIITIANTASMTNVAYVRFCIYKTGIGTKPVIAVDEEIKYTQEGFLADNIKLKAENVIGLPSKSGVTLESPNGTLFKIAVNDDGTLSAIEQ